MRNTTPVYGSVLKSQTVKMFCVAVNGDIDEYTDSVTAYISKCVGVIPKVNEGLSPTNSPGLKVVSVPN